MKINKIFFKLVLVIVVAVLFGCTQKWWYEEVQRGAEDNCRYQPPSAIESCLDRVNKSPYEDYEKARTGSNQ